MQERTEEQKLTQAPVVVVFGSKEYKLRILTIKESREWRQQTIKTFNELPQYTKVTSDDPEKFNSALESLLITMPDTVVDLFFAYAKDLDRKEIEAVATDQEMYLAWEKVVELSFPLLRGLVQTMSKMAQ
jgi:hypothetical protein